LAGVDHLSSPAGLSREVHEAPGPLPPPKDPYAWASPVPSSGLQQPTPPDQVAPAPPGSNTRAFRGEHASSASSLETYSEGSEPSIGSFNVGDDITRMDTTAALDEHAAEWNQHLKAQVANQLAARSRSRSLFLNTPVDKSYLQIMVESLAFHVTCAVVIVLNAAFLGFHADWGMKNALAEPPIEDPFWFQLIHQAFLGTMAAEIGLRMMALRLQYFFGADWKWNIFDVVLVLSSIADEILSGFGLRALRVLRALRMARVLRLVRSCRLLNDLRLMVAGITQSLPAVTWALLLLFTIMYMFSICFMQAAALHIQLRGGSSEMRAGIQKWYPSLVDTLMSLLQCITSGVDWHEVSGPLGEVSFMYRFIFAFYILFVVIGVLNVLTGIFVDRACELSGLDRDLVIKSRLKRDAAFLCEMRDIFEEADTDRSGKISWEEFQDFLKKEDVRAYLATQQLDAFEARQLFNILHIEDDEEVGIEEFIMGLKRVKGMAKSVDVVALLQETRNMGRKLRTFMQEMQEQMIALAQIAGSKSDASKFEAKVLSRLNSGTDVRSNSKRRQMAAKVTPVLSPRSSDDTPKSSVQFCVGPGTSGGSVHFCLPAGRDDDAPGEMHPCVPREHS